jgi:cytoskeletal protein CcmA (bactofilin family)
MAWKRTESDPQETPSYTPPRPVSESAPPASSARRERAVIGNSISVQGDISGEEDLTIFGRVQGKIDVKGNSVTVGESGRVQADVWGKTIVVEGEVEGNLYGGDQIVLRSSGSVHGNLTAPRVALEDGAQFKGSIDMEPKRQPAGGSSSSSHRPSSPSPSRPSASSSPGSGGGPSAEGSKAGGQDAKGPGGEPAKSGEGAAPAGRPAAS